MTSLHPWDNNKQKGTNFEICTEYYLDKEGIYVSEMAGRLLCEEFNKNTEMDRIIFDEDGFELAIVEIKSGQFNDDEQARRLVSLAKQENLKLIFATPDGTIKNFSQKVLEVLNKEQCFVIRPDKLQEATQINPKGINYGLPPGILISPSKEFPGKALMSEELSKLKTKEPGINPQVVPSTGVQKELAELKNKTPPRPKATSSILNKKPSIS